MIIAFLFLIGPAKTLPSGEIIQDPPFKIIELGAFLSGGIDSSLIVTLLSQINPNIDCFTIYL